MRRCHSLFTILLAFVWAFVIVCSDDVMVYADYDGQDSILLSSMILDGTEVWSESNTDFVLHNANSFRNTIRNRKEHSRIKPVASEMIEERCALQLIQCRKYIYSLEVDQYLNEKVIMNYLHRQDGDK